MADFNVERLTEKLSQIGDILDGIKTQNALNIGDTNRTLSSVTEKLAKLDDLSTDECSTLITSLIGELKKNLDDKYSLLNIKFTEIESQFKNLVRLNENNIEQNQIKDLFDIISTNLNVFSKQVMSQGDILNEITLRIESLRMESSQNREFGKSISIIKSDIEKFNNGFESIIININSSFEKVTEELKKQSIDDLQNKVEDMKMTMNAVISTVQIFDQKNKYLEELLNSITTKEDIEQAKETMYAIIEQNKNLAESVNNLASVSDYDGLIAQLNDSKGLIEQANNKLVEDLLKLESAVRNILSQEDFEAFKKDLGKLIYEVIESTNVVRGEVLGTTSEIRNLITVMNSLDFKTIFNKVLNNLTSIESNIKTTIYEVINKITQESEGLNTRLSADLNGKFDILNDNISKIPGYTTEKLELSLNDLSNKMAMIQSDVKEANNLYTESFSTKYDVLADKLNTTNIALDTISSLGISSLKFNIEDLSQKLEQAKDYLSENAQDNYNELLDKMKTLAKGIELLDDKISKPNNDAIEIVLTKVAELTRKVEDFNINIEKVEFAENINRLKEVLNFMPEIIKESIKKDFTTTIETDISTRLDDLENLMSNITTEYSNSLTDFKTKVSDSIDIIKENTETSDIKLNNTVFEINAMKAEIQKIYVELTKMTEEQSQRFVDIQDNAVNRIEEVINGFSSLSHSVEENNTQKVEIDFKALDEKLENFISSIQNKIAPQPMQFSDEETDTQELTDDAYLRIEAKLNKIKDQLNFNSMNYFETAKDNMNTILEEIEPIKARLKTFADEDYQTLMNDFKIQLEYFTNKLKSLFVEVEGTGNTNVLDNLFAGLASLNGKMEALENGLNELMQNGVTSTSPHTAQPQANINIDDTNITNLAETLKTLSASSIVELKNGMEGLNKKLDLLTAQEKELDFLSPEKGLEQLAKLNEIISVEKLNALNKLNLLDKLETLSVLDNIDKIPQINTFLDLQNQLREIIIALDQKINAFYKNMEGIDRLSSEIKESFETSKEDMLKSVIGVFEQISFVEEAEDIKDFIDGNVISELKTVSENLAENAKEIKGLKHVINSSNPLEYSELEGDFNNIQLAFEKLKLEDIAPIYEGLNAIKEEGLNSIREQINILKSGSNQNIDYTYSLQDVESDIAKLRMTLNELQKDEKLDAVSQNIEQLVNFLDGLRFDFTREDLGNMHHHIAKMTDEITDLSARTNKLILTSEDSRSDIKNTVLRFEQFLNQIYGNIKPIADMNLSLKIETLTSIIDRISKITETHARIINNINEKLDTVESNIVENIKDLKKLLPQSGSVIGLLERKFEEQEERLASMEEKMNEFMETMEAKGGSELGKQIMNIDKKLAKLNKSIEKVTSYVDEE
ncbi:hypothetical protein IJ818_04675 [bacterium]|nr:hypothetical protein [bacterium]